MRSLFCHVWNDFFFLSYSVQFMCHSILMWYFIHDIRLFSALSSSSGALNNGRFVWNVQSLRSYTNELISLSLSSLFDFCSTTNSSSQSSLSNWTKRRRITHKGHKIKKCPRIHWSSTASILVGRFVCPLSFSLTLSFSVFTSFDFYIFFFGTNLIDVHCFVCNLLPGQQIPSTEKKKFKYTEKTQKIAIQREKEVTEIRETLSSLIWFIHTQHTHTHISYSRHIVSVDFFWQDAWKIEIKL